DAKLADANAEVARIGAEQASVGQQQRSLSDREWSEIARYQKQNPGQGLMRYVEEQMRAQKWEVRTDRQAAKSLSGQMRQDDKSLAGWKNRLPRDQYEARADEVGRAEAASISARQASITNLDHEQRALEGKESLSPDERKRLSELQK